MIAPSLHLLISAPANGLDIIDKSARRPADRFVLDEPAVRQAETVPTGGSGRG